MTDEMRANPKLLDEYENTFDSEERVSNALKITKENFTIDVGVVEFDSLLVPDPIKKGRKDTYLGLSTSVAELGIVEPIHVMVTENYADWVQEHPDEEFEGYKYTILDGFRRIWAGYKNGLTRCNAVIWDFEDKEKGVELATTLSLILNKKQKHSWGETWYLYQLLEVQSALSPGTLEYLLQLNPGDAMKLKDIMSCEYPDVKEELMSDKKTIDQAYNMLQKYRKEEDKLLKEDNQGIADLEQADGLVEKAGDEKLSNEDVNEILEMDTELELTDDNFDELLNPPDEVQDVNNRHPLDPALKAETLMRDNYQCVCCENGKFLPMRYKMSILQSHHKVAVAHGGPDNAKNIVTVCMACHTVIHCLLWSGLKFGMKKEDFDKLPEEEKSKLIKILDIASKDWEAAKRLGKTADQIKEEYKGNVSQFKMPGTDLAQNREAVKAYNANKEVEE